MRTRALLVLFLVSCVSPPPVPCTECSGVCVDLQNDSAHCGSCTTACAAGEVCRAGTCKVTVTPQGCVSPQIECSDVCVDPRNDAANCGACGTTCAAMNVNASYCAASACTYGACNAGFLDCDGNRVNGCEAACNPANASGARCGSGGACDYTACLAGFDDCDGNRANGCERALDSITSCGSCTKVCRPANARVYVDAGSGDAGSTDAGTVDAGTIDGGTIDGGVDAGAPACGGDAGPCAPTPGAACSMGQCGFEQCVPGFGDCDGFAENGCETNVRTDSRHCGACGTVCAGACIAGRCNKRAFITFDAVLATFGGADAGDGICESAAAGRIPAPRGPFQAWLGSGTSTPATRWATRFDGGYVRLDGVTVADSFADLSDGSLDNPLNVTEVGTTMQGEAWTGLTSTGSSAANCANWTNGTNMAPFGNVGVSNQVDQRWTAVFLQECSRTNVRLYCFEQ
ncbi:MAG: hypothetical protein JNK82_02410 [Myxococcaceae bacterium]|nr:hypothetical protein [Myxococcaceae bacterium]